MTHSPARHRAEQYQNVRLLILGVIFALLVASLGVLSLKDATPARASHTEACDGAVTAKASGPSAFRPSSFAHQTILDARGSNWTREAAGDYPVIFKDQSYPAGGTACFLGGTITSSAGNEATWDAVWHHTVGLYTDHPYTTVRGTRMDNQGDCVAIKDPGDASLTRIQGAMLTNCHDDAVENDLMKNVEVTDSIVEGYVLFAGRGGSAGAEDGRNNTYKINKVIGYLKPQVAVYKGPVPGTGPLFKRPASDGSQGYEPKFTITNSIFRVDKVPNHGDLSIPPGPHSGNTIVWTGAGSYPGPVPAGFTVTKDLSVWANARAAWLAVPASQRTAPGAYQATTAPAPTTSSAPVPTTTAPATSTSTAPTTTASCGG